MAYVRTQAERYVNRVRNHISQVNFQNEDTSSESEAAESSSTEISDDFILERINSAVSAIVSRCKAAHVYDLIVTDSNTSNPSNPVIRFLYNSTKVDGNRAVWRDEDRARRLESTGSAGTSSNPAFTYEGGEITFYPSSSNSLIRYVTTPNAATLKVTQKSDIVAVDERFEAAIVNYVAAKCMSRLRRADLESAFMNSFEDEISIFELQTKTNRTDNREVASE